MERDICIMILFRGLDIVSQETGFTKYELNLFLRNHIMLIQPTVNALLLATQPILQDHSASDLSECLGISEDCVQSLIEGGPLKEDQKEQIVLKNSVFIEQSTNTEGNFGILDKESQTDNTESVHRESVNDPEMPTARPPSLDISNKLIKKKRITGPNVDMNQLTMEQSVSYRRNNDTAPRVSSMHDQHGNLKSPALTANSERNETNANTSYQSSSTVNSRNSSQFSNLQTQFSGNVNRVINPQNTNFSASRTKNVSDPLARLRNYYRAHIPPRGDIYNPDYSMFSN